MLGEHVSPKTAYLAILGNSGKNPGFKIQVKVIGNVTIRQSAYDFLSTGHYPNLITFTY